MIPPAYRLVDLAFTVLFGLPPGCVFPGKNEGQITAPKEARLPLCKRNRKRHCFPRLLSLGNGVTTEVNLEPLLMEEANKASLDGKNRCCVKVCSPADLCFLEPPGFELFQNSFFKLIKPACLFNPGV